jgi:hypothetical protein
MFTVVVLWLFTDANVPVNRTPLLLAEVAALTASLDPAACVTSPARVVSPTAGAAPVPRAANVICFELAIAVVTEALISDRVLFPARITDYSVILSELYVEKAVYL